MPPHFLFLFHSNLIWHLFTSFVWFWFCSFEIVAYQSPEQPGTLIAQCGLKFRALFLPQPGKFYCWTHEPPCSDGNKDLHVLVLLLCVPVYVEGGRHRPQCTCGGRRTTVSQLSYPPLVWSPRRKHSSPGLCRRYLSPTEPSSQIFFLFTIFNLNFS